MTYRDPAGGDAAPQQRALLQRLLRCRRGLIIGPHGSGKSTLLQSLLPTLRQRFGDVAQVRLSAPAANGLRARRRQTQENARLAQVHQAGLCEGGLLIVDGMEQLSSLARLRVLAAAWRRRHHVLGTSHHRLSGFTELFRTEVTESLIESLAESLLAGAAAEVASVVRRELSQRDLARVANIRDLWFEMYDVVAKIETHPEGWRG